MGAGNEPCRLVIESEAARPTARNLEIRNEVGGLGQSANRPVVSWRCPAVFANLRSVATSDHGKTSQGSTVSNRPLGRVVLCSLLCCGFAAVGTACGEEYDWDRKAYERGSLGEELYEIWRKDAERSPERAEARVEMLDSHEELFVDSVDQVAPPDELESVDQFLRTTNRSIDSGLLPTFTRKVRIGLDDAAENEKLLGALAADTGPSTHQYLAASARPNLPVYMLNYEEIRPASRTLIDALLNADGVQPDGSPAEDESTAFIDAQRAVTARLADSSSESSSAAVGLRDVLVREDGRFAADRDVSLPAVRYDRRGLPLVADASGRNEAYRPIPPFVDDDGDGLADVDDRGRFVVEDGPNRKVEPFASSGEGPVERDDTGRAIAGGTPVFEYVDLSKTGLHWSARQLDTIVDEDIHWKTLEGLPALLGERVSHESETGTYQGYAAEQPAIDALEAGLAILDFENLPPVLRSLSHFLDAHSGELARLLDALGEAKSKIDALPDAELSEDSTIGYDLLPILEETAANPGLWQDVMDSLEREVITETGTAMATMLKYRDLETLPKDPEQGGSYEPCFQQCKSTYEARETENHPNGIGKIGRFECIRQCAREELFTKETDFDAAEARDNRSTNQQLFHLLRDTAGTPYELEIEQASIGPFDVSGLPPIVELPGAAEAFIRSIAGNLKLKNYISDEIRGDSLIGNIIDWLPLQNKDIAGLLSTLSPLFGEGLSEEPTPDEITRLFNQPDLKFTMPGVEIDVTDPVCKDGYVMANHHADKLFASEASGLIDAIQPFAKAFSDHDREDLFTGLFKVIHEHYSNRDDLYETKEGSPSPMKGAGLRDFEPALLDIARSGAIFEALHEFAVTVDRIKPVTGEPFEERLRQLVYNATRTGRTGTGGAEGPNGETSLTLPDGTEVDDPSRMHFLLASVSDLIDRVDAHPEDKEKLRESLQTLTDALLETERGSNGEPQFQNEGAVALFSLGARELAESAEDWNERGVRDDKLTEQAPEAAVDAVTSRLLPALIDLVRDLGSTDERRETIDGLGSYVVSNGEGRDHVTGAGYRFLAASGSEHDGPIARALADVIDPERSWKTDRGDLPVLSHALTIVDRLLERDEPGTGLAIARRGLDRRDSGTTHLGGIAEVVGDYYRADPPSDAPYSEEDYRRVFGKLAAWIGDDVHGLEQLYDIIQRRSSAQ